MAHVWRWLTAALLVNTLLLALPVPRVYAQGSLGLVEPQAGSWKTHVLAAGSELRLAAPPDAAATQAELAELRALAVNGNPNVPSCGN